MGTERSQRKRENSLSDYMILKLLLRDGSVDIPEIS